MNCNVGKTDRVIRVIVAIVLLWLGYSLVNAVLKWILYIIAVYLVITVIIGKCYLYSLMKVNTCKTKAPAAARPAPKPVSRKKKR